jgi:hypothetical protein
MNQSTVFDRSIGPNPYSGTLGVTFVILTSLTLELGNSVIDKSIAICLRSSPFLSSDVNDATKNIQLQSTYPTGVMHFETLEAYW